jgi:hypothetical protein
MVEIEIQPLYRLLVGVGGAGVLSKTRSFIEKEKQEKGTLSLA